MSLGLNFHLIIKMAKNLLHLKILILLAYISPLFTKISWVTKFLRKKFYFQLCKKQNWQNKTHLKHPNDFDPQKDRIPNWQKPV